jgi:hypothetical protein
MPNCASREPPGILALGADLRTSELRTSIEIAAPEQGYPLTWVKRLVRRLDGAPSDLHVETLVAGQVGGLRGTLERLRPEPADILPRNGAQITGFRLSLFRGMGNTRGNAESGFIRSVDDSVDRFHTQVVAHLDRRTPRIQGPAEAAAGVSWPGIRLLHIRAGQSRSIRVYGLRTRTWRAPKSTSIAMPSSTPTIVPRPYWSWETRSPRLNSLATGMTGAAKGLVGRWRRGAEGFVIV